MRNMIIACLALFLFTGTHAYAGADPSLNFTLDPSATWTVTIHSSDGGYNGGVYAGPYDATWNTTPVPQGYSKDMTVFCADIRHYDTNPSSVDIIPFTTQTSGSFADNGGFSAYNTFDQSVSFTYSYAALQRAAWLYDNYLPCVRQASGSTKQVDGAALQIAIWKAIETDPGNSNPVDTSTDSFWISSYDNTNYDSILSQANTWYSASVNKTASGTLFLADHSGQYYQNMLGPAVTPELPGLPLLLSGLMAPALFFTRRRMCKKR